IVMDAKYVLCRWKKRLWPAKVLARTETSANNKRKKEFFLDVQILSLDEKIKVKSTGVKSLKKSQIEDIASLLASQNEALAPPLEELAYRRSLRVALDVLNKVAGGEKEDKSEEGAGSPPVPVTPSRARISVSCTRVLRSRLLSPAGPPPARSACLDTEELPVKRLRLEGSQIASTGESEVGPVGHSVARHPPTSSSGCVHLLEPSKAGEEHQSSEGLLDFSPLHSILDEDEEEEEPPRILLYHEPRSFEVGMLVWHKYQKYPFWPAVVKSLRRREKKASVLFIEGNMNPKGRGITVSLRRLKHFDCKEKQILLHKAKQDFEQAVGWCVSLITDYRVRLGCGSFAGSFLEYYAANISYPVRKSIQQDILGAKFPQLSGGDPEEPEAGSLLGQSQPCRKVLPDRSRAARDRANQKLVEYIVKAKGAESHLRAILKSRKPSRWLTTFLSSSQYVTCVETYLEDEEQLDLVVKYLQGVYQEAGSTVLTRLNGDRIRLILDVLLPEAIICAISAVDAVDYKTAEEKYIKGPSLSYREKEMFDNQLLEERNRRHRPDAFGNAALGLEPEQGL
ncbi:PREDICTED: PWWP domain-containing protein MUM1-like, partial [Chrysochloris asiatica]|uniref:PWWP domain-containing protein MUM1-like n=1 Tax=Chrysochloris asiatica TaxID=185453 RepID=A0A9B0U6K3_CHRAS